MDFGSVLDAATSPDRYGIPMQPFASHQLRICYVSVRCLRNMLMRRHSVKPNMEEGEESRYSVGNVQCLLVFCHPLPCRLQQHDSTLVMPISSLHAERPIQR